MEPLLASIILFGGNFAPRGWAFCDGQLLPISQHQALFSLLGTTYGGDGRTTFALPDLRGRVPMHPGAGPGLSPRRLGDKGGQEQITLTTNELPTHHHELSYEIVSDEEPEVQERSTADRTTGAAKRLAQMWRNATKGKVEAKVEDTGGGQPFPVMQPYVCVHYIIALQGIYPSRS